ncbi:methylated-DNA--[protein]-cysteine S-methyltransferase [Fusobacterium nucleatum]|uniref:methylated-DNA--[protein]-cysteine S-methyltransferase n=1 Tax=Fusobacterium nucleatum TaxID=851 RepID=UPI0030D338EB
MKNIKGISFLYNKEIGYLEIIEEKDGISEISFLGNIGIETRKNLYNIFTGSPLTKKCSQQLEEYFNGKRKEFNIKLDIRGTKFQKQCWKILTKVPYGETISYSDEARMIGNDKAVRAVGSANGKNCIPIIIPCHRIVYKGGEIGGYSGGEGGNKGIEIKKYLLELEKKFK